MTYTPVNFVSVAEATILLILGSLRKITRATNYIKRGEWKTIAVGKEVMGKELHGRTVGILGLGRIGAYLAKLLKCFEVRVLAYDPYISVDKAALIEAKLVDMKTLLKESDVVTIHVPLSASTRHLIGEKELKSMKTTSIIVNTSRGAVIDERALVVALEEGWIAGAGLDVFEQEPPKYDNPLFRFENVFATPHCAGSTEDARRKSISQVANSVVEVLQGKLPPIEFIANSKVLENLRE